jgi:hypothetical protein
MSLVCCKDSLPFGSSKSSRLSAAEYDAIFEERQRRFKEYAARSLHRAAPRAKPIVDPIVHTQTGYRIGKGAIGAEQNGVLNRVATLSDGYRRHRTIPTQIGPFMIMQAGRAYADSDETRLHRVPSEG